MKLPAMISNAVSAKSSKTYRDPEPVHISLAAVGARYTITNVPAPNRFADPYQKLKTENGETRFVEQGQIEHSSLDHWLYTRGMSPCLAVAVVNESSSNMAFTHMHNPCAVDDLDCVNDYTNGIMDTMESSVGPHSSPQRLKVFVMAGDSSSGGQLASIRARYADSTTATLQVVEGGASDSALIDGNSLKMYRMKEMTSESNPPGAFVGKITEEIDI